MCGRFVGYRNIEELLDIFPIDRTACASTANYNIAPSQEVLIPYLFFFAPMAGKL